MLRIIAARSNPCLEQGIRRGVTRQWLPQRIPQPLARSFADNKTVSSGTQSGTVAGVPLPAISATATANPKQTSSISPGEAPKTPSPSTNRGNLPPTGTGTASTGPASGPPPPPAKRRLRFRSVFLTLLLLSALGYAGGVYYSLVNDNFHDFFTEYVPFGEDAVAYFEEREFRKRFPSREITSKTWPQRRGENKVTIGRSSGVNPRVAATESDNVGTDLGQRGRHVSALEENKSPAPQPNKAQSSRPKSEAPKKEEKPAGAANERPAAPAKISDAAKKDTASSAKATSPKKAESTQKDAKMQQSPATGTTLPAAARESTSAPSTPATSLIDQNSVSEATEPAVQELVKMLNSIITAVNESPEASKYSTTMQAAKSNFENVITAIKTSREQAVQDADTKIKNAHLEFDDAAKELVRRMEEELQRQETQWREEYENEREKLSASYQQKLSAELDAAKKVAEQHNQNALLEMEISLQKKFLDSVNSRVEEERGGRLSKLNELSASVDELNQLTGQWNSVVEATMQTQHVQVALGAVRAKLEESEFPQPFIDELVALKEVSRDNEVVTAAIASLNPVAYQRGVPSVASLIDRFRRVASEVRKASLLPEEAGVASHAASAVLSRLMFQKKSDRGLPAGDDVEATLARTEALLEEGDLDSAAREMNGLKGWAGVLSKDWTSECRRVLEVKQAVDVISTEARLQSLLVD